MGSPMVFSRKGMKQPHRKWEYLPPQELWVESKEAATEALRLTSWRWFTDVHVVLVCLHETRGLLDGVGDIRALLRENLVAVQHLLAHREILHSQGTQSQSEAQSEIDQGGAARAQRRGRPSAQGVRRCGDGTSR